MKRIPAYQKEPTQEYAQELFDYDPHIGILIRKPHKDSKKKGSELNINGENYIIVSFCGKSYPAHRIIWLHQFGYFPNGPIDHINRIRCDNRLANLRAATYSENNSNCGNKRKNNISPVRGVCFIKSECSWKASISKNYKNYHLIQTKDFYDAVAYRLAAEQCLNWSLYKYGSSAIQYIQKYVKRI